MIFLLTNKKFYDKIFIENKKGVQKMRYKGHTISDETVNEMMKKLDLSFEEACDLVLSDMGIDEDETVKELSEKARKNRVTVVIHDAKGEKKTRKPKERKENVLKKELIKVIFDGIVEKMGDKTEFFITNPERYIDFTLNGKNFTISLTEHRPKKEKKGEKK